MSRHHQHPAQLPDWDNLAVIHRNVLPPRSDFCLYETEAGALTRSPSKALRQCLSGTWQFHFTPSPFESPGRFWEPGFDASSWSPIVVPGHWQLQGLGGRPQYTNLPYPFPVDPPHVPYDDNETGRYLTTFRVKDGLGDHSSQLRLRFEGVDSAFRLWVNGHDVGYSQGARNPSEFDVTPHVRRDTENLLAVEVYARCDGSYLEDQDQWWLSGIFRDVFLHAFPRVHPRDIFIRTEPDGSFENGDWDLRVDITLSAEASLEAKLLDDAGTVITRDQRLLSGATAEEVKLRVSGVAPWTAETPNLYTLVLTSDAFSVTFRVGFRQVEIANGVFLVNGRPVKFRGVNRHEHHPDSGRAVPYAFLERDLHLMKQAGINAVRTSHYPNDPRLYDLADELGLWIIDEADLECHGFDRIGADDPACFTTDNPDWKEAYLDRAAQLVHRDRNHPSVVLWSLGNEAWFGQNMKHMYELVKQLDPTRPIHYEQDREAETMDVLSIMYPCLSDVKAKASEEGFSKPYLLCEFAYAGGNGVACVDEYFDLFYRYPRCMGGFLWQWANNGLRTKTSQGVDYFGYGGDFGDSPNDGAIMINGICTSAHEPGPNFDVYRKAIQPLSLVKVDGDDVVLQSRYDFVCLDHLRCHWSLTSESNSVGEKSEVEIPKDIEPHSEFRLRIPGLSDKFTTETYLNLSFTTRGGTSWAAAGHQVAWHQARLSEPTNSVVQEATSEPSDSSAAAKAEKIDGRTLKITSSTASSVWTIDLAHGTLVSWIRDGSERLARPLIMDLWRATTEPDRRSYGVHWLERRVEQTRYTARQVEWHEAERAGTLIVKVHGRVGPPVQAWGIALVTTYTIKGDTINIVVKGHPHGPSLPQTLPRIGLSTALHGVAAAQWCGRGPGESYVDKRSHQAFGTWRKTINDLWVEYEEPQESGNRTDVRWVEFWGESSERRMRASFGVREGCSFAASHYDVADVAEAKHPFELAGKRKGETIVRLDWQHQGVGSGLIETGTVEQGYKLSLVDFEFNIDLD